MNSLLLFHSAQYRLLITPDTSVIAEQTIAVMIHEVNSAPLPKASYSVPPKKPESAACARSS